MTGENALMDEGSTVKADEQMTDDVREMMGHTGRAGSGGLSDNVVLVGRKDTMRYISAVMTQFNNGASEVILKARGRAISRAVDVAERLRNQFMTNTEPSDISIKTEEVDGDDGPVKVSAMEITLTKK